MLLERLSLETGVRHAQLLYYAETASKRYFLYTIKKRNGEDRWIAHPSKPLKGLQRWLNFRLFALLPVHSAATAYKKGSSIWQNASRHSQSNFTLRVDFEDFFPSYSRDGVVKFLEHQNNSLNSLTDGDIQFVADIVTREGELTIGAPSSPMITNAMMFTFDRDFSSYCDQAGLVYTRYADDIFVSANDPGRLTEAYNKLVMFARQFPYAQLRINHRKTKFLSRKYQRKITGLVITSDRRVSIGRDRKREIKALVHQFAQGVIDIEKREYLRGMVAFCYDVDREFFNSLVQKYGRRVMSGLIG